MATFTFTAAELPAAAAAIDTVLASAAKTAIVTMGLPGAGKSTTARKLFSFDQYTMIDPDAIKETLPGYDPKNPATVHAESKRLAEKLEAETLAAGRDFILDGTGTDAASMARKIGTYQGLGYNVTLLYVKVDVNTAKARNAQRARTVPEHIIDEKYAMVETAYGFNASVSNNAVVVLND